MPRQVLRGEDEEEALLIIMIVSFFVSFQIFFGQDSWLAGWLPFRNSHNRWLAGRLGM